MSGHTFLSKDELMSHIKKLVIATLLVQTVCFSARKYMSGGEMYSVNGKNVTYLDNHPEELSWLATGANGYGCTQSLGADRTGHGTSSLNFTGHLACGSPDVVQLRTFIGTGIGTVTPPVYLSFWIRSGSSFAAPQDSGVILTLVTDATHHIRIFWSNTNKLGISINGGLISYCSTSHPPGTGWFHMKLYSTWTTIGGSARTVLYDAGSDSVVSTTVVSSSPPGGLQYGVMTIMDDIFHGTTISFDDMFLNDSEGTTEVGFADDSSYIMYNPAVSDTARVGWVAGDSTTTNLWDGVDNVPPRGNTAETATTNIFNAASSATDNYDAAVKSYASLGVPSNHYVRVVQAIVRGAEHSATGSANGAVSIVSNPSDTTETIFPFGGDAGAHVKDSTWWDPCGVVPLVDNVYASYRGRPVYIRNQSMISRLDRPIVRVGKRTASTKKVCVDQLGLLLEVSPNPLAEARQQKGYIINPFGMDFNNSQYFFATSLTQYELH